MNQPQRSFDTLQYAKRLLSVGFTDQQAEVQAEAIKDLIDDKLATKVDIEHLKTDLKSDINNLKSDIDSLTKDFQNSERSIMLEIRQLEERFNYRINEMSDKLTIRLGGMIAAGIFILGAIIKLI